MLFSPLRETSVFIWQAVGVDVDYPLLISNGGNLEIDTHLWRLGFALSRSGYSLSRPSTEALGLSVPLPLGRFYTSIIVPLALWDSWVLSFTVQSLRCCFVSFLCLLPCAVSNEANIVRKKMEQNDTTTFLRFSFPWTFVSQILAILVALKTWLFSLFAYITLKISEITFFLAFWFKATWKPALPKGKAAENVRPTPMTFSCLWTLGLILEFLTLIPFFFF